MIILCRVLWYTNVLHRTRTEYSSIQAGGNMQQVLTRAVFMRGGTSKPSSSGSPTCRGLRRLGPDLPGGNRFAGPPTAVNSTAWAAASRRCRRYAWSGRRAAPMPMSTTRSRRFPLGSADVDYSGNCGNMSSAIDLSPSTNGWSRRPLAATPWSGSITRIHARSSCRGSPWTGNMPPSMENSYSMASRARALPSGSTSRNPVARVPQAVAHGPRGRRAAGVRCGRGFGEHGRCRQPPACSSRPARSA